MRVTFDFGYGDIIPLDTPEEKARYHDERKIKLKYHRTAIPTPCR